MLFYAVDAAFRLTQALGRRAVVISAEAPCGGQVRRRCLCGARLRPVVRARAWHAAPAPQMPPRLPGPEPASIPQPGPIPTFASNTTLIPPPCACRRSQASVCSLVLEAPAYAVAPTGFVWLQVRGLEPAPPLPGSPLGLARCLLSLRAFMTMHLVNQPRSQF